MDYYNILQLTRTATQENIQNAYRKLGLKYHPAKNSEELEAYAYEFALIGEAYEVLSNPTYKAIYDQFGEQVLKEGFPHHAQQALPNIYRFNANALQIFEDFFATNNPFSQPIDDVGKDLEGSMFGGAYGGANMKPPSIPEDVIIVINCSLEEFYNGCMKIIKYNRLILALDGKSTKVQHKSKEIEIKPGYGEQTELRFKSEGNDSFGYPASDLLIKFKLDDHPKYSREGNDLVFTYNITLQDALCATPITITALDLRILSISMDEVITPKTCKLIEQEGMPIYSSDPSKALQHTQSKGNLYVKFKILFPQFLDLQQKTGILAIFNK